MNRARLIRGMKIAWSVLCGLAVVLLIVLWVRSYWWFDWTRLPTRHFVASWRGRMYFDESMPSLAISGFDAISVRHHLPYFDVRSEWLAAKALAVLPPSPPHHWKVIPYPLIVVLVAAFVATPWLRYQFSLRTLLIATTLVAIALALAVYAARK